MHRWNRKPTIATLLGHGSDDVQRSALGAESVRPIMMGLVSAGTLWRWLL